MGETFLPQVPIDVPPVSFVPARDPKTGDVHDIQQVRYGITAVPTSPAKNHQRPFPLKLPQPAHHLGQLGSYEAQAYLASLLGTALGKDQSHPVPLFII